MKVVIVGGVAGGASCAARLRRLDEQAEILMVERGPYVSFANCGLPYYVGGVIEHESDLLVANETVFREHFSVDCRTRCEAVGVSAENKTVELRDVATGEVTSESYDKLVLSPGAPSVRPPLPGIDLPGIFPVRTVPDASEIREWIERGTGFLAGMEKYSGFQTVRPKKRAVVVGAGFIGLEMSREPGCTGVRRDGGRDGRSGARPARPGVRAARRGFPRACTVSDVALNDGVAGFEQAEGGALEVSTQSGKRYHADLVILALGVRPDTTLASMAGIEIGELGGIRVDEQMRTSDPDIFAVGDAVEVRDFVTGQWSLIALAGPANRQARIAADVIAGRDSRFRGTQGTSIIGLFGGTAAWTGASEKTLKSLGDSDYEKIYIYPNSHAGYYPGAKPIAMKVLFRKSDGRLLGAQAVGEDGVDKRISTLALAIQMGATVYDLEEAELCYAPPFGSAKDPVNFAGMVAADILRGDMPQSQWDSAGGHVSSRCAREGRARRRASARTRSTSLWVSCAHAWMSSRATARSTSICRSGQRAYSAARILAQNGFDARVISGGMLSHAILYAGLSAGPRVDVHPTDQADTPRSSDSPVACTTEQTLLVEGARWDAGRGELLRVDIIAGRVYRDRVAADGALIPVRSYQVPTTVGAITPVAGDDGWLLAAGRGFVHLDPDGSLYTIAEVAPAGARMNDGACDPQGRFWAGSMADDHRAGGGALYRLDRHGRIEQMLSGLTIPNGLGWSPDCSTMYLIDSGPRVVHAYRVRPRHAARSPPGGCSSPWLRSSEHPTG